MVPCTTEQSWECKTAQDAHSSALKMPEFLKKKVQALETDLKSWLVPAAGDCQQLLDLSVSPCPLLECGS